MSIRELHSEDWPIRQLQIYACATEIVQVNLRMREEFRRKLERAAEKKDHSLNTEMIERLEASFGDESKARDQAEMIEALRGPVTQEIADQLIKEIRASVRSEMDRLTRGGEATEDEVQANIKARFAKKEEEK